MIRGLIVFLFFALLSCSGKKTVPGDVLPPEKMKELLWDLSRADHFSQDIKIRDTSLVADSVNKSLYQKVFAIHKVTPAEFEKSYAYYQHHPLLLRVMLDSLYAQKNRLNEQGLLDRNKPLKTDSVRNDKSIDLN